MEVHPGLIEQYIGIGFRRAAVAASGRAERAIAQAEECRRWGDSPAVTDLVDDLCALLTTLSDEMGDLDASTELSGGCDRDGVRAARLRTTFHRVQATTAALLSLARLR